MPATTREMLIEAGMDLFYQHGFHAVGLDQILARVGVTKTTFYNHFESKDELAIAVLHERDKRETEDMLSAVKKRAGGDPRSEILAMFDVVEELLAAPDFRGCMFMKASSEYPSPNDPVHKAAMVHGENLFREFRVRAGKAGAPDPVQVASQLMLVLTGAILSRHSRGVPDQARSARAAAGVIVDSALRAAALT